MRFVLALLLSAFLSARGYAAPANVIGARAVPTYRMILYARDTREPDRFEVKLPPAKRLKAIIPFADAEFAMVGYECAGVTKSGRLTGCSTKVEPKRSGYEEAAAKLLKATRITGRPAGSYSAPIAKIFLDLRLFNTVEPIWRGPCWPPVCALTPAPPPPPPKATPH